MRYLAITEDMVNDLLQRKYIATIEIAQNNLQWLKDHDHLMTHDEYDKARQKEWNKVQECYTAIDALEDLLSYVDMRIDMQSESVVDIE